jgi:hypothetical protein
MGSGSGSGKISVLKEIDGVTRALKVAMLQMEGAVDLIRSELRANKSQDGHQQNLAETAWNPILGAEIVVDDQAEEPTPAIPQGTPTKKVSILDILERVPSGDRSEAGFTSEVFHDLLLRLENELVELRRKIDSAATWIRHLKEKTDTGFVFHQKDK